MKNASKKTEKGINKNNKIRNLKKARKNKPILVINKVSKQRKNIKNYVQSAAAPEAIAKHY